MATTVASLRILLGLDSKDVKDGAGSVKSELKGIQTEANKTKSTFSEMKAGLGAGLGIGVGLGTFNIAARGAEMVVSALGDAVAAASNLNETMSKSTVVFGQSSEAVSKWGDTAAESLGLSKQAAVESAASFGNLFTGMGLAQGQAAAMSQDIVGLAADLASFNNIGTDEALQKLRSGLVGEAEPLRSVGVLLNEATVAAKATELGFTKTNGAFTEAQKVQARYALILDQTKTAQGDFARTSDGLANSQRIANAEIQDAMAKLGEAIVPFAAQGAKAIATVAKAAADAAKDLGQFVDIVGDIVVAADKVKSQASDGWRLPIVADAIDAVATGARQLRENNVALLTPMIATSQAAAQQAVELADVTRAHLIASEAVDDNRAAFERFNDTSDRALGTFNGWPIAAGNAGASMTTLAGTVATLTDDLDDAAAAAKRVQDNLDNIERNISINIRMRVSQEGGVGLPPGSADVEPGTQFGTGEGDQAALDAHSRAQADAKRRRDQDAADAKAASDKAAADAKRAADKAAADAKRAHDKAVADAKRAADDLARSQVEIANKTFDRMADAAHKYFDALHTANLKAIEDDRKRADAAIENQKRANLEPATAAEARLRAVQQQRQLARLQADLAAAKTPEERLSAQQALSDFQAQARIDFLHKQADDANKLLDEQKKTQDAGFDAQTTAENKRNADQVNLFDENLKSLREYVGKHPAEWKKSTDAVAKILKAAGVDYEKVGKENADAYIRGVGKGFAGFGVPAPGGKGTTAGASPALMASAGLIPVGGGVKGDVYLDGNKVGEFIERYLAANASATTSGYTARHN